MPELTRRAVARGLVAVAGLAAPQVARAAARQIRLGHNGPDDSTYGVGARAFAAAVAADKVLCDVLTVQVRGKAQLGDEVSMLQDCAKSTLDMMICATSTIGNVVPEIGLVNAPFLFANLDQARATLDGPLGAELAQFAPARGLCVTAWGEAGLRHFTANKPIREPADLHGLRIRVPQSEVMTGGLRALGAETIPLSFDLVREALRTGQVEAQENSIAGIEGKKLNELQKYLSLTGHSFDGALFLASADLMEDLGGPQRAALAGCARVGAAATRQFLDAAARDGIARLTASGMIVVDRVDIAAFRAASEPYLQSLGTRFGADLVARLRRAGN